MSLFFVLQDEATFKDKKMTEPNELFGIGDHQLQKEIAKDTLERYSGSPISLFQPYILLTNFGRYVEHFAKCYQSEVHEGAMFRVAHSPEEKISIIDFKIGSPAAALVMDLLAFLPVNCTLLLGMCAGLREDYKIGEFFVPVGSIRGDATSDFYFPPEVPALANFTVQKVVTNVLDKEKVTYHLGITHTTNKRFWEFNVDFKKKLQDSRAQALEMECATIFTAGYHHRLPSGALLLISDIPLKPHGIKTKKSSEKVFKDFTSGHISLGIVMIKEMQKVKRLSEYRKHVH